MLANRRFTDLHEWGQRTMPLSLEAEIQRRLLPGAYGMLERNAASVDVAALLPTARLASA